MADGYSHEWHLFVCKVRAKQKLIEKHDRELQVLYRKCAHEQTQPGNRYVPGTKIVRSSNITFDLCQICGKKINVKAIYGEYA